MIVTSKHKEVLEIALRKVKEFLIIRGLEIKEAKTRIIHLDQGFDFLGFHFQFYNLKIPIKIENKNYKEGYTFKTGNFITSPKKENTLRIYKKCRAALYKYPNNEILSVMLNSIIRGWVLYYGVSSYAKEKSKLTQNLRKVIVIWASNKEKISNAKAYYKYLRYDVFRFPIEEKMLRKLKPRIHTTD